MKKQFLILLIFWCTILIAQEKNNSSYFELNYFYGNIIEHSPELKPIIQNHTSGFILSWNKKKLGNSKFEHTYNFPDFGVSISYQDYRTQSLGKVYSAYGHYNFYLLNRNSKNQLKLTSGFGLGYNSNPFDKETNNKNLAIGSKFVASVYLKLNYQREYIFDRFGLNAGFSLIHYSNGSFKVPNLGINTFATTIGVNYNLDDTTKTTNRKLEKSTKKHPFKYNFVFRTGFNESKINGSGLFPFYTLSAFSDKKLSYTSTIAFGFDLFFPTYMKEYIEWNSIQQGTLNDNSDWKRVGVFVGYELNMDIFSVIGQVGYHVYYPYEYVSEIYERFGFRKQLGDHFFADLTLKINMFRAEGLEFGLGYRI